jgi:hypothetical protein
MRCQPDVRCKMCKDVGGAYCDDCAATVYVVEVLWRHSTALAEIAEAPSPPSAAQAVSMRSTARLALGRDVWTGKAARG